MDEFKKWGESVDDVFAILNILKLALNKESFENWLQSYHNKNLDEIFLGYQLFILTGIRAFIKSIIYEDDLCLGKNYTLYRASFEGKEISNIPNSGEKIVFVKNLWESTKSIRKAKSLDKLSSKDVAPIFEIFDNIFNNNLNCEKIEKNQALLLSSIFKLDTLFTGNINNIPVGYYCSIFKDSTKTKYLNDSFTGYSLTLQYLWYILLDEESFKKNIVSKLHDPEQISKILGPGINLFKDQQVDPKWHNLDRCSRVISNEILEPLEKKYDIKWSPAFLFLNTPPEKELFSDFLKEEDLKEPEYLTDDKSTENSLEKRLDQLFYGHHIYTLDTKGIHVFNGTVAALTSVLGHFELNYLLKEDVNLKILKINHPVDCEYQKDAAHTSYAILFGVYGAITDGSGWLVFLDCSVNFESPEYLQIELEATLEALKDRIELTEYEVDLESFTGYLQKKSIKFESTPYIRNTVKRRFDDYHGNAKGKTFEILCYMFLSETKKYESIEWSKSIQGEEIDILIETDTEIYIYECKVESHLDSKDIEQMKRKISAVTNDNQYNKKVIPNFIFYSKINENVIKRIEENNILVTENYGELIRKSKNTCSKKYGSLFEIIDYSSDKLLEGMDKLEDPDLS